MDELRTVTSTLLIVTGMLLKINYDLLKMICEL
jgi:hypothetical protein